MSTPLTREDVIEAYRMFLDRDPESAEAIDEKIRTCPNVLFLARQMLGCEEFSSKMETQHARRSPSLDPQCEVQMTGRPEDLARLRAHVQETWTKLGKTEPHYSVLTGPQFLPEQMTQATQDQFYATGAAWVEELRVVLRRNSLFLPKGLVVDFGCGLGRVGEHLSLLFDRYLGVDISPSHLSMARDRLVGLGRTNVEFELLPDFMKDQRKADLIYSVLVLQHNPPPVMLEMFDHLLLRLNKGALAFIQISTAIYNYEFNLGLYLQNIDKAKLMEMHALPQSYVFDAIERHGCKAVEVYRDDCTGPLGESYRFLITKK